MKRLLLWGCVSAIGLLTLGLLTGCMGGDEVKIGVAVPLTGDLSKGGTDVLHGVQLAIDDWNQKGGVLGKPIELIQKDDKGDAETAAAVAEELANEGVDIIIGHFNSDCSMAAMETYIRRHKLMISPSTTTPELTDSGYKTIFRVIGRDDKQGEVAADYVSKAFPEGKVAVVHDGSTYGKELATVFLNFYGQLTESEPVYYGYMTPSGTNRDEILDKLKSSEADFLYFGGAYPTAGPFLKAVREAELTMPMMSGDGTFDPSYIEAAGAENAEGVLVTFVPDFNAIPEAHSILKRYQAKYGDPGPYSLFAYEATNIVLQAVEKAQSAEDVKVAKAMRSMNFETPFGSLHFDDKGDINLAPYIVWTFQDGEFVTAPPPEPPPAEEGEEEADE